MGRKGLCKTLITALILAQLPAAAVFAAAEVVNINPANSAGVSHNVKTELNVSKDGMIFNNAANEVNTVLNGIIAGNINFNGAANAQASVILNEVVGISPSSLNGIMEIAGQRADLIIANQRGINANGIGFINTNRAVLTTGTPVIDENGSLASFNINQGNISLSGGIDAQSVTSLELLSQTVQSSANINADKINMIAGNNNVNYNDLTHSAINGTATSETTAIDLASVGSMYANSIFLVSTADGMGVNNKGLMCGYNELRMDVNGSIINGQNATLASRENISLSAKKVENEGNIYSEGNINILSTDTLQNKLQGKITSKNNTTIEAFNIDNAGNVLAGYGIENGRNDNGVLTLKGEGILSNSGDLFGGKLVDANGFALANNDGNIYSHGDINAVTNIDTFTNGVKGTIVSRDAMQFKSQKFVNKGFIAAGYDDVKKEYITNAGGLNITADYSVNNSGIIVSNKEANIVAKNEITNSGYMYAGNLLDLKTTEGNGKITNNSDKESLGEFDSKLYGGEKIHVSTTEFTNTGELWTVDNGNSSSKEISIDATTKADIGGSVAVTNGSISINGGNINIKDAQIISRIDQGGGGYDITVNASGNIDVINSHINSSKGTKLDASYGYANIAGSKVLNDGTGPIGIFGKNQIMINSSQIVGAGSVMYMAPNFTLQGNGAQSISSGDTIIFANNNITNTETIAARGYVNMVMTGSGYFDNKGKIFAGDYLQVYGSPYYASFGVLGSDTSISLWGRYADASYANVKAPSALMNGYAIGTEGIYLADFNSADLTINYILVAGSFIPSRYGKLASVAQIAFTTYKGSFSEPIKNQLADKTANFVSGLIMSKYWDNRVAGTGDGIAAADTYDSETHYKNYELSLSKKFGKEDLATGYRVLSGGSTEAIEFLDTIASTGEEMQWENVDTGDTNVMKRVSRDGTVSVTYYAADEFHEYPRVEIHGSGTDVNYLPYRSEQIILFK